MEREPFNQPNNTEEESSFEDDFDGEQIVEKTSFDQLEGESLFANKLKEEEVEEKTSAKLVSEILYPKIGQQIKNWGIKFGKDIAKNYSRLVRAVTIGGEEIKTKEELLSVPAESPDSIGSAFRPDSKEHDYLTWLAYKKQSPEKTAAMGKVVENAAKEYTKTHTEGLKAVEEYDKKVIEMSNRVLSSTDITQVEKGYQITYNEVPVISLKRDYIDNKIEELSLETDYIKQKGLLNELAINLSNRAVAKDIIPTRGEHEEETLNIEIKIREGLEKKLSDFLEEAINQREVDKKENEARIEARIEAEREAAEAKAEKQQKLDEETNRSKDTQEAIFKSMKKSEERRLAQEAKEEVEKADRKAKEEAEEEQRLKEKERELWEKEKSELPYQWGDIIKVRFERGNFLNKAISNITKEDGELFVEFFYGEKHEELWRGPYSDIDKWQEEYEQVEAEKQKLAKGEAQTENDALNKEEVKKETIDELKPGDKPEKTSAEETEKELSAERKIEVQKNLTDIVCRIDSQEGHISSGETIEIDVLRELLLDCGKLIKDIRQEGIILSKGEPNEIGDEPLTNLEERIDTLKKMITKLSESDSDINSLVEYVKENYQVLFLPIAYSEDENKKSMYDIMSKFNKNEKLQRLARFTHYIMPEAIQKLLENKGFKDISPAIGAPFEREKHESIRQEITTESSLDGIIYSVYRPGIKFQDKTLVKVQVVVYTYAY